MANNVRQYVGARYVPKFDDQGAWQSGTSYEALTIVTYNNASYTSKIPVPATVGNPADNDTYWVLTGNYNAQVEDYRQTTLQVQEGLNEEITNRETAINDLQTSVTNQVTAETTARETADNNLENSKPTWWGYGKKIVVYGDSTTVVTYNWVQYLTGATITNRGVGGYNLSQILASIQSNTDNNTFDYAIVAGGINNWQGSDSLDNMISGTEAIINELQNKTQLLFVTPMFSYNPNLLNPALTITNAGASLEYYIRAMLIPLSKHNIPAFNPFFTMGVDISNYTTYLADDSGGIYVHENELLGKKMANAIMQWDFSTICPPDVGGDNMLDLITCCSYLNNTAPTIPTAYGNIPILYNPNGINLCTIAGTAPTILHTAARYLPAGTKIKVQGLIHGVAMVPYVRELTPTQRDIYVLTGNNENVQFVYNFTIPESGTYDFGVLGGSSDSVTSGIGCGIYCDSIVSSGSYPITVDGNIVAYLHADTKEITCSSYKVTLSEHAFTTAVLQDCLPFDMGLVSQLQGTIMVITDNTRMIVPCILAGRSIFIDANEGTANLNSMHLTAGQCF